MLVVDTYQKMTAQDIASGANLLETDLQHRRHMTWGENGGSDATAMDRILGKASAGGQVKEAYITPDAVPAGGTKTLTIDLQKSTGGGAWASILSATTTLSTSSVARTPVVLSLSGTQTFVKGDVFRVVTTIGGTGGTGVQGWNLDVYCSENCT